MSAPVIHKYKRSGKRHSAMSDINVTPFVDVMLVLLVIFMVTAPLLTTGISLDLPKGDGKMIEGSDQAVDISVDSKGRIYIGTSVVAAEQIVPKIKAMTRSNPKLRLVISADKKTNYGAVVELMARLRAAGFTKVGLKTDNVLVTQEKAASASGKKK